MLCLKGRDIFCSSFDNIDVIAGQGTIAIEILEEIKDADYILASVGGGLIAYCCG